MKEIELLAPAGSFEKAKIAYLYGADAVYCGTSSLSLRTRADMQNDDLEKTIKYAHEIEKKVYVTLNPQIKQMFTKAAQDALNTKQKLLTFLN